MCDGKEIWHVLKLSNIILNVSDTTQNSDGFISRPKLNFYSSVILLHLIEVLVMLWLWYLTTASGCSGYQNQIPQVSEDSGLVSLGSYKFSCVLMM